MGKGRFIGTELDLYVSVDGNTAAIQDDVEDVFRNASAAFHEATDGLLSIANIYWVDDSIGRNVADVFCVSTPNGGVLGQAQLQALGVYGGRMEVFDFSDLTPLKKEELGFTILHELGHYVWGLGDEYAGPTLTGPLDLPSQEEYDTTAAPDYRSLFLSPAFDLTNPVTGQPYDMNYGEAFVLIGESWELRICNEAVIEPTGIVWLNFPFGAPFSAAPSADPLDVRVRPYGTCGSQGDNFCIMNGRGGDTGRREICGTDNHDLDQSTSQSYYHNGQPCWNYLADYMSSRWDVVLTPPSQGQPNSGTAPPVNVQKISAEHRCVLVLDRSGSMEDDEKIEGARGGLEFWINAASVQDEFLGIVWFNSEVEVLQQIENVADIADLEAVKDEVLGLPAEGATNIKDALHQAADMLIDETAARGPSMFQYIVLMTDGMHNVPGPSSLALDAVPKCQENGIQIFTLGLGSAENIDQNVLEDLAKQTSGGALVAALGTEGQTQASAVFGALFTLRSELRGTLNAIVELEFQELSGGTPFDEQMRKWARNAKQPPFKELLEAAGAAKLDELTKDKGRFASTSMWVEKGADAASFGLLFEPKQPVWLYLFDPAGNPLDPSSSAQFRGRYPFEAAIVKEPARGRWTVLAVRQNPGAPTRASFRGGIENKDLVATGNCNKTVSLGSPVRLWANVYWEADLSGIYVRARVRDPSGVLHHVVLHDERADEPFSGAYEGMFTPTMPGRHEGEIRIFCKGKARLANGIDRLSHTPREDRKGGDMQIGIERDRFERVISIYFDAGTRPVPKDREKSTGILGRYRRRRTANLDRPPVGRVVRSD